MITAICIFLWGGTLLVNPIAHLGNVEPLIYRAEIKERYISVDNVCAWPNLTMLGDSTIIATIFNKPSHGLVEGDVECWASKDGTDWKKHGTPALHDATATTRTNVAAGLTKHGDLLVLSSGWLLKPAEAPNPSRGAIIKTWISRSSDGGKTWTVDKHSFPPAEKGRTEYIPFGDIFIADDGSLRTTCYSITRDRREDKVTLFRSDDDGYTWKKMVDIIEQHNETALFRVKDNVWLAAARSSTEAHVNLFRSEDDGYTWQKIRAITELRQIPAHIMLLKGGQLLLTYGNRNAGRFGIKAKVSDDNGITWSQEITLIDDLSSGDSGYPSSVQLASGEIVTAYYAAGTTAHHRYHMGTVKWILEKAEK